MTTNPKTTKPKRDQSLILSQPLKTLKKGFDKSGPKYLTDRLCDFYDYLERRDPSQKKAILLKEKLEDLFRHAESTGLDITQTRETYQTILREYSPIFSLETQETPETTTPKKYLQNIYIRCEVETPPEMMHLRGDF